MSSVADAMLKCAKCNEPFSVHTHIYHGEDVCPNGRGSFISAADQLEKHERRIELLIREFEGQPSPVNLGDLGVVVEELHNYLEGGQGHLAVPLLGKLIRYHIEQSKGKSDDSAG